MLTKEIYELLEDHGKLKMDDLIRLTGCNRRLVLNAISDLRDGFGDEYDYFVGAGNNGYFLTNDKKQVEKLLNKLDSGYATGLQKTRKWRIAFENYNNQRLEV